DPDGPMSATVPCRCAVSESIPSADTALVLQTVTPGAAASPDSSVTRPLSVLVIATTGTPPLPHASVS
ncbi:hypothetical protein NLL52_28105, partial [Klebsiella pneumoniae]|nr:hypothetical protein [Klebsiella pneumoniae]